MRILVVNPYPLGPFSLGGAKRIFRMLRHFSRTEKVWLACFADNWQGPRHYWPSEAEGICEEITTVPLERPGGLGKLKRFLFGRYPLGYYHYQSIALKRKVEELAKRARIGFVHVEFFEMAQAVSGIDRSIPRVLVSQEVVSLAGRTGEGPLERVKGAFQRKKLKRLEKEAPDGFDRVYCITAEERRYLEGLGVRRTGIYPHVVDTGEFRPSDPSLAEEGALFYLGDFNHRPNLDALRWFTFEVMPLLLRRSPRATLHVAGANLAPSMLKGIDGPGIRVHGEVPDLNPLYDKAAVFVNPIVSGGGMRGKVLEAMAKAKAIVTTPLGIQGIDARDGKEALVAPGADGFAGAVAALLEDRERRGALGMAARARVSELYDERKVFDRLLEEYRAMARGKGYVNET